MTKITMCIATAMLLAACGGDSGSTDGITAGTAETYCERGCAYELECDPAGEPVEVCTADCLDDVVGVVREDVFIDITNCFTALSCDASDDACLQECTPTASHDAYEAACRSSLAMCDVGAADLEGICEVSPDPSNDDTGYFCVFAPAIMDELTACFDDGTCQEQSTCLQTVLEAHGIDS